MSEPRKMAHEQLIDLVRPAIKSALDAVPEAEAIVLVVPWAMGLNFPPGLVIMRTDKIDVEALFRAKGQLLKMIEQIDRQLLLAIRDKVTNEQAARNVTAPGEPR